MAIPAVKVEVSGARGESLTDIARRTGAFGVDPTDSDSAALAKYGAGVALEAGVTAEADRAQDAANFAEGFSGPVYASQGAGEAATTEGHIFRVSNGDGPPETTTAYRRTSIGSVELAPLATTADLASTDTGKGAALSAYALGVSDDAGLTVREKLVRQVETRDFGDKARSKANFILSKPNRIESYELDARETGIAWDWDAGTQSGTDDAEALQEGLNWLESKGGGTLRLPFNGASDGGAIGSELVVPSGVALVGADPNGSTLSTTLVGTGTSGAVLRIKDRGAAIRQIAVTSSDARWAEETSGTLHGLLLADDDAANPSLLSKTWLSDIYVLRQPGDAFHGIGSFEHSRFEHLWAVSCKRHGFAFDDGTRAGYANETDFALFMARLSACRALDCGGNAGLFGHASAAHRPAHVTLDHFEALGCGWDTSNREYEEQIYLRGDDFLLIQPDIEDQQFGNATLTNTGDAKTSRVEPSGGVRFLGQGLTWTGSGHVSSVKSTLVVVTGSSGLNVDLGSLFAATGAWGQKQPVMVTIPASVTGRFVGKKSALSAVWTKYADIRSAVLDIQVDGTRYLGTTSSVIDTGIADGAPVSATISTGTLIEPATRIIVDGGGSLAIFQYVSGRVPTAGHRIEFYYDGTNATTITNSGNIVTKSGSDLTLDAARRVASFVSDGTKLMEQ